MRCNGTMTKRILSVFVATALSMAQVQAQEFPSKMIRIVVPLGTGSGLDSGTRAFAEALSKVVGRSVIVENKPGANTGIGVMDVLNAPADGHTLLALTGATVTINPILGEKLNYDPNDIRPVAGGTRGPSVLLVGPASPYKTLQDLIAAARKERESVTIAEYGQAYKLGALRLEKQAGIKLLHVPYKSPTDALTNAIGGQVAATFMEFSAALPLIKEGKLRALAQTGSNRMAALPEVPTVAEAGLPGYTLYVWSAFAVNKKTPDSIIKKLEAALLNTYERKEMIEFASSRGVERKRWTGKDLAEMIDKERSDNQEAMNVVNQR
jgi:tripartite-type tricarboxylate transporter receptor subunit TctC